VIFGAAGDLTKRKLVPALYNLSRTGLLNKRFAVIGFAVDPLDTDQFRQRMREAVQQFCTDRFEPPRWEALESHFHYISGNFTDAAVYTQLGDLLKQVDQEVGAQGNVIFYLATPPAFFDKIACQLATAGLTKEEPGAGWRRVIIEKPFGHDLESARELNQTLHRVLDEPQIYRIDHYLGKETVQNILLFRFTNGIFEPIWNRRYVDHVQIMVAESIGIEGRGAYYEQAGVLRDMIQNHMFQVLTLIAMEPPISFAADDVLNEKVKVLHAIKPMTEEQILACTVRGQYGPGEIDGERVPGYRQEPNVSPTSATETYAALKLFIENWRWADVPFYLRSGKRLDRRDTEVVIQFRRAPLQLVKPSTAEQIQPNQLTLQIQPEEGIRLRFHAKVPGPVVQMAPVDMTFRYSDLAEGLPNTGYETLLYDCMIGDRTLFHRADMVEEAWRVATPILDVWKAVPPRDFPNYAAGIWGPPRADELVTRDGREWAEPT
jgi:glucose-6-phosphate 1-dehydrogenase